MNSSIVLHPVALGRFPAVARALLRRWMAQWRGQASVAAQPHVTAAALYARAARYEATQPSFAADLRAAAEGLDAITTRAR